MNRRGRVMLILIPLLALGFIAAAKKSSDPATQKRAAVLSLIQRQAAMWDAAVVNDWPALYSLLSPAARKKISLREYAASPHAIVQRPKAKVCGAVTALPSTPITAEYLPKILYYRFAGIRMSADGRRALVISDLSIFPAKMMGPTAMPFQMHQFWVRDNGVWYSDLEAEAWIHSSGAISGADPMAGLDIGIDPAAEAAAIYAEGVGAPEKERDALMEQALLLDTFGTIRKGTADGTIPRERLASHLDRVFKGALRDKAVFPAVMEAAAWYGGIGDTSAAFGAYDAAARLDPFSEHALAGAARYGVFTGKWEEAAGSYRRLLDLSALGIPLPPSVEEYIVPVCHMCDAVGEEGMFDIAERLVTSGNYSAAAAIYRHFAERHPGFAAAAESMRKREKVTVAELLGVNLARQSERYTGIEVARMLETVGLSLSRPGDAPTSAPLAGELLLSSLPLVVRSDFYNGYSTGTIPAKGMIRMGTRTIEHTAVRGNGWLFVRATAKGLTGGFYPDGVKTGNTLAHEVKALAKGQLAAAVRVGPLAPKSANALEGIGADTALLTDGYAVILGVKGGAPGSARCYRSNGPVRKLFGPALKKGAVSVKGSGTAALITLAR